MLLAAGYSSSRQQFPLAAASYLVIPRELSSSRESWQTSGERTTHTMLSRGRVLRYFLCQVRMAVRQVNLTPNYLLQKHDRITYFANKICDTV